MRHADRDLDHAGRRGDFDDRVQGRDRYLPAFEAEALGGDITFLTERLEALGLGQMLQDLALFACVQGGVPRRAFDAPLNPRLLVGILDMHELDADGPAIGSAEDLQDLPQRGGFQPQHVVDEDRLIEIGFGKAVGLGIQFRMRRGNL